MADFPSRPASPRPHAFFLVRGRIAAMEPYPDACRWLMRVEAEETMDVKPRGDRADTTAAGTLPVWAMIGPVADDCLQRLDTGDPCCVAGFVRAVASVRGGSDGAMGAIELLACASGEADADFDALVAAARRALRAAPAEPGVVTVVKSPPRRAGWTAFHVGEHA